MYKSLLLIRIISCSGLLSILSCTHQSTSSRILSKPQQTVNQLDPKDNIHPPTLYEQTYSAYTQEETLEDNTFTKETNTQIFLKDTYGHTHLLEVCLEKDTILSLKQKIQDIPGYNTSSQLIYHGNKQLNNTTTTNNLFQCGLQQHSSLELNMKTLGGDGFECPHINESTNEDLVYGGCFWREICKGLTIWIECENPHCVSKGSRVAVRKYKGKFNMNEVTYPNEEEGEKPLTCTACKTRVKPINIKGFSFRECKYKLWGFRKETQNKNDPMKEYKKEGIIEGDLNSHKFESDKWTWWSRLVITARDYPKLV